MKRILFGLLAVVFGASGAIADGHVTPGDTVTAETAAHVAEITRIASAMDVAIDAKDWDLVASFYADEVTIDFTAIIGGDPATIPAEALIASFAASLSGNKASFHQRTNQRVTFNDEDSALLSSYVYSWNRLEAGALPENGGNPFWETWASNEHGFVLTDEGWKINFVRFYGLTGHGNEFVRDTPGT